MIVEKITSGDLVVVKPDSYDPAKAYPILIHLHGVGGRTGLDIIAAGELPLEIQRATDKYDFIAVAPHTGGDWTVKDVEEAFGWCHSNLPGNWKKVYLAGTSLGGGGVTKYISFSDYTATTFAAVVTACGLNWISNVANIANSGVPLVMFHAVDDTVVNVSATNNAYSTINGLNPKFPVKKVLYPNGDHWIWGKVFSPTSRPWLGNETPPTIYDWLLMNEVGSAVPVPESFPGPAIVKANAGTDKIIFTPESRLEGTQSTGYASGSDCSWTLIEWPNGAGPYGVFYKGSGYVSVDIRLPVKGRYKFMLTVRGKDATGKLVSSTDEMIVNFTDPSQPPGPVFTPTHTIETKDGIKQEVIIKEI